MSEERKRIEDMITALKQQRDEIALRMHLAGGEAKQEWDRLEDKLVELSHRFDPLKESASRSSEEIWESLKLVGAEFELQRSQILLQLLSGAGCDERDHTRLALHHPGQNDLVGRGACLLGHCFQGGQASLAVRTHVLLGQGTLGTGVSPAKQNRIG